jgi:hypothetical protein
MEATALYATVMLALLVNFGLNSGLMNRLAGHLPVLRGQTTPSVVITSSDLAPVLQAKIALANAKCIRQQQIRMALDQAKMAREMAQAQRAQAKLMAAHYKWAVKSATANNQVFATFQTQDGDQDY